MFAESEADIVVFGGGAGGGKTFELLRGGAKHCDNPDYGFTIFRRTSPQITNEGGLWDESMKMYLPLGAEPVKGILTWRFPSGATGTFRHLQHEETVLNWQGSQIAQIGFDELTHFTEKQFFYMLSRNRSVSGVKPQIRATTNPGPGWVKVFLAPWLDKLHLNPAQSGEIRYFIRKDGEIVWVDKDFRLGLSEAELNSSLSEDELEEMRKPKSVTFIRSSVYDNPALLKVNPQYLTNLKSLPPVEQARLLHGDWDVFAGAFFSEWTEAECVIPPMPVPTHWHKFGGLDWGKQANFSFGLYASDEQGNVFAIDEEHGSGLSNVQQADRVMRCLERNGVPVSTVMIAADPSMFPPKDPAKRIGEYNVEEFWRRGLQCVPAVNDRVNGWTRVKEYLHAKRFKVFRGCCEALIREFPLAQYHKTRLEDMDDSGDTQGHFDGLNRHRYAMMTRPSIALRPKDTVKYQQYINGVPYELPTTLPSALVQPQINDDDWYAQGEGG